MGAALTSEQSAVKDNLERIARLVMSQMRDLEQAVQGGSRDFHARLQRIIDRDTEVDNLEISLDDMCIIFMNHQAPFGKSLRFMLGAIDVAAGLERIGDCIEYIARNLQDQEQFPTQFPEGWKLIQEMTAKCGDVNTKAIEALLQRDADAAAAIPPLDDLVDALQSKAYQMMINNVRDSKLDVELGMRFVLMANKFESIADIACHIAETVVFMVQAKRIRHGSYPAERIED